MKSIVVVHSGGLDSSVLLNHYALQGTDCHTLSINYGQRHRRELEAAGAVVKEVYRRIYPSRPLLKIGRRELDLPQLKWLLAGSSQTSSDVPVPHGHYAEASMKKTVVPNRNMILLAMAIGYAVSLKAEAVVYAAHQGDHAIYPDCRPEFVEALAAATALCDYEPPKLLAPFLQCTKAEIVRLGYAENAPLGLTYSCYEGDVEHCGKCGTCVERREAFELAGVADPTTYRK